jgi:hypothetical protein
MAVKFWRDPASQTLFSSADPHRFLRNTVRESFGCPSASPKDSDAVTASFESLPRAAVRLQLRIPLKDLPDEDIVVLSHVPKTRETGIPLPGTWDPGNPVPGPGFFGRIPGLGHPRGISRERDIPGLFHKTGRETGSRPIPGDPMPVRSQPFPAILCGAVFDGRRSTSLFSVGNANGGDNHALSRMIGKVVWALPPLSCAVMATLRRFRRGLCRGRHSRRSCVDLSGFSQFATNRVGTGRGRPERMSSIVSSRPYAGS